MAKWNAKPYRPTSPIKAKDTRLMSVRVSEDVFEALDKMGREQNLAVCSVLRNVITQAVLK